eukprot:Hpha_TRINITY_DN15414_c2_g1::TRINITY_DN15414_c2_g1_i3::g.174048::m.174048
MTPNGAIRYCEVAGLEVRLRHTGPIHGAEGDTSGRVPCVCPCKVRVHQGCLQGHHRISIRTRGDTGNGWGSCGDQRRLGLPRGGVARLSFVIVPGVVPHVGVGQHQLLPHHPTRRGISALYNQLRRSTRSSFRQLREGKTRSAARERDETFQAHHSDQQLLRVYATVLHSVESDDNIVCVPRRCRGDVQHTTRQHDESPNGQPHVPPRRGNRKAGASLDHYTSQFRGGGCTVGYTALHSHTVPVSKQRRRPIRARRHDYVGVQEREPVRAILHVGRDLLRYRRRRHWCRDWRGRRRGGTSSQGPWGKERQLLKLVLGLRVGATLLKPEVPRVVLSLKVPVGSLQLRNGNAHLPELRLAQRPLAGEVNRGADAVGVASGEYQRGLASSTVLTAAKSDAHVLELVQLWRARQAPSRVADQQPPVVPLVRRPPDVGSPRGSVTLDRTVLDARTTCRRHNICVTGGVQSDVRSPEGTPRGQQQHKPGLHGSDTASSLPHPFTLRLKKGYFL